MLGELSQSLVLAADVGGTKTNLGLAAPGKTRPVFKVVETYPSREASSLEQLLERFLERHPCQVAGACIGVAGPVTKGQCRTTNLAWRVSENSLRERFHWERVMLVNDLVATAMFLPLLRGREWFSLKPGRADKAQNLGVLAPGTGLGQALLIPAGDQHLPLCSEGGHVDFAPRDEEQVELWRYLRQRWEHVSLERVLSGPGLFNIYCWLRDSGRGREPAWLAREMESGDPPAVISSAALEKAQPLCRRALELFASILGAAAGNLALGGMTLGGLYLAGGIAARIMPRLDPRPFLQAFTDKGRLGRLLSRIPVRVVLNTRAPLLGAARMALERA